MDKQSTLNCSGMMTDILLEGIREMIGTAEKISKKDVDIQSEKSIPSLDKYSVMESLQQEDLISLLDSAPLLYGERGACGIAVRIGEGSFRCFLRTQGEQYSLTDIAYRLMNSQHRIVFGLKQLAKFAHQNCGALIEISEDDQKWYWNVLMDKSLLRWNSLYSPYIFGLLREFFIWTSGGRYFMMEEILGETATQSIFQIAIKKQPLGN